MRKCSMLTIEYREKTLKMFMKKETKKQVAKELGLPMQTLNVRLVYSY